jgi:hypothetical protein
LNRARRRRGAALAAVAGALVAVACGAGHPAPPSPKPSPPVRAFAATSGSWLGLAYNSSGGVGTAERFALEGIAYDRSGPLEVKAGLTPATSPELARGLRLSLRAGMIPDIEVDPGEGPTGCTGDPNASTLCLPVDAGGIRAYVDGFVATAGAIRQAYPGVRIVFEPMNEPWDWGSPPGLQSGRASAREYAAVLVPLLTAARTAGIPLADIYVPGAASMQDGSQWISDLYAAAPCLAPGSGTCGPIDGWNLHPYGLPGQTTEGIGSVPGQRALMRSGADNIIISEMGFCADDIAGGADCDENRSDITGTAAQTARWLSQTLTAALDMRRAGWLKGLLVWDRSGGGWAMEAEDGRLTPQGRVLVRFARSVGGG